MAQDVDKEMEELKAKLEAAGIEAIIAANNQQLSQYLKD